MSLLYLFPILFAIIFLVVHVSRGGTLSFRNSGRQLVLGLAAVIALGVVAAFVASAM